MPGAAAIKAGTSQYGMQTFDQSLFQLYKTGLITLEEAIRRSSNPNEFKLKVQGISATGDETDSQTVTITATMMGTEITALITADR